MCGVGTMDAVELAVTNCSEAFRRCSAWCGWPVAFVVCVSRALYSSHTNSESRLNVLQAPEAIGFKLLVVLVWSEKCWDASRCKVTCSERVPRTVIRNVHIYIYICIYICPAAARGSGAVPEIFALPPTPPIVHSFSRLGKGSTN